MEEQQIQILADAMWGYFHTKYLLPYLSDSVCYFMATVTTAPSGGIVGIRRPFDNEIFLPYAWSAETLQAGETCMVLVFGDLTNAVVIGKGDLSDPGIYARKYAYAFSTTDWTASGTNYVITLTAATHGCGTEPTADVYKLIGSDYVKYYGYPSEGWTVSVDSAGNITLTAKAAFNGKLIVR